MSAAPTADARPVGQTSEDRGALVVFALAVALAVPIIFHQGRSLWFAYDDWFILVERSLGRPSTLFDPHNEHLTVIPSAMYRVLFRFFGLHHYWPYQLLAVVGHLAIAVLLRIMMRRLLVPAWVATTSLLPYLVFGAGRNNVTTAFQVTNSGAVAFGLASLLVVDYEGTSRRRYAAGVLLAIAAIGMSGTGVAMLVATTTAITIRRGWRAAALHAGPPAMLYLAWYLTYRPQSARVYDLERMLDFAWFTVVDTFVGLGQFAVVAWLLGLLVLLGTGGLLVAMRNRADRSRLATLAGTTVALAVFLTMTAATRGWLLGGRLGSTPTRYVHIAAALLLPLLAFGATIVIERWRWLHVAIAALLVVGVPGNIRELEPTPLEMMSTGDRATVPALAMASEKLSPPPDTYLYPELLRVMTAGWLLQQWRAGRVPDLEVPPRLLAEAELRVSFATEAGTPDTGCRDLPVGEPAHLAADQRIAVSHGSIQITELRDGSEVGPVERFDHRDPDELPSGVTFRALRDLTIIVRPREADAEVSLCP